MRTIISIMALLLTLAARAEQTEYIPGRLVLKFKNDVKHFSHGGDLPAFDLQQVDDLNKGYGCYRIRTLKKARDGYGGVYLLYFPDSVSIPGLIGSYEATGLFRDVEPDYVSLLESLPVFSAWGRSVVFMDTDITSAVTITIYLGKPFIKPLLRQICFRR